MSKRLITYSKDIEEYNEETDKLLNDSYIAYTDGSCDNYSHYRAGGSAYIIIKDNEVIKIKAKGMIPTTNNRAELLAIISAANSVPEGSNLDIFTDSKYCILVLDKRNHKKNMDLIRLFNKVVSKLNKFQFHWVKGHNGNKYNEMVDTLAYGAYREVSEKYNIDISPRKPKKQLYVNNI